MTGDQSLIARAALGVAAGIAGLLAVHNQRLRALPRQSFERLITVAFVVSRVALWLLVFVVLRITARGDITIYVDEAGKNLQHLVPYIDFASSYAPLHSYMDALLLGTFHTPIALILFAIGVEAFLLPLWFRVGRSFLSDREVRTAAILYLTSAVSLQFVAIDGQDNIIIAVLLVLSLLLVQQRRAFSSGVATGVGIALLKFLPLLYVPAFFLAIQRRWRWVAGLGVVIALSYGGFLLLHPQASLLQPLAREGKLKTPGDLPYLIEAISGISVPSFVWNGLLLLLLAFVFVLIAKVCHRATIAVCLRALTFGFPALTLMLMLFAKKSWPPYLMLVLFPVCLLLSQASRLKTALFALFGVVVLVEHSFYATLLHSFSVSDFHQGLVSLQRSCLVFLFIEILLLAGYLWLLLEAIQKLRHAGDAVDAGSHPSSESILTA
jgi:hypothetical protein